MIGQPWTVPWALITQAAKTGLGRGLAVLRVLCGTQAWSHNILIQRLNESSKVKFNGMF